MQRWTKPPNIRSPKELMAIMDPIARADEVHRTLRALDDYRSWLVRARAEAVGAAHAHGVRLADLGARWGVGSERVRQMMFQSGDGRSGWTVGVDSSASKETRVPLPFGTVHAVRLWETTAACGSRPVTSTGADFTSTVYQACAECQSLVAADDSRSDPQ